MRLLLTILISTLSFTGISAQTSGYDAAREAFDNYRFDQARSLLDTYKAKRKRDQVSADLVENPYKPEEQADRVALLSDKIELGLNMIERVENVVIIDTLTVDRDDFFRAFKLDPSTGLLADTESLGPFETDAVSPVYVSEGERTMIWAKSDESTGNFSIMESSLLSDGSREAPVELFNRASIFGDGIDGQVYSPFLMADGITLYFAADGPQSLGGLDIFIARRDSDGSLLQPSNLGMPYNSPANDFMMAIDEVTGAGWWATDRDTDEEHVKIFVFKPSDRRINIDPTADGLAEQASLKTFNMAPTEVRSEIFSAFNNLNRKKHADKDFEFAMPDGRILTRLTDFRTANARELIADWHKLSVQLSQEQDELSQLRQQRADNARISSLENRIEQDKRQLKRLSNDIVRCELR